MLTLVVYMEFGALYGLSLELKPSMIFFIRIYNLSRATLKTQNTW